MHCCRFGVHLGKLTLLIFPNGEHKEKLNHKSENIVFISDFTEFSLKDKNCTIYFYKYKLHVINLPTLCRANAAQNTG